MNNIELHARYMRLQSIPLTKITIKERNELQEALKTLINDKNTIDYDLYTYYKPRWEAYDCDIRSIKAYTAEQIAMQEAIIILAQNKINELKKKLGREKGEGE